MDPETRVVAKRMLTLAVVGLLMVTVLRDMIARMMVNVGSSMAVMLVVSRASNGGGTPTRKLGGFCNVGANVAKLGGISQHGLNGGSRR